MNETVFREDVERIIKNLEHIKFAYLDASRFLDKHSHGYGLTEGMYIGLHQAIERLETLIYFPKERGWWDNKKKNGFYFQYNDTGKKYDRKKAARKP